MAQNVIYLDDENFNSTIASGVTLVDFYADWCGPCKMIAPIIEDLSNEMSPQAKFAKLDVEKAQNTTSNFQVTSIPTVIVFKDGKEVKRIVGLRDKETLRNLVKSVV